MPESLYHEFANRTKDDPHAIAIRWRGASVSYGDLYARVESLAIRLNARPAKIGDLLGIGTSRGPGWIIAMLAVMRSRAAWVPLDPAYPEARLQHMIDDSGVQLILVDSDSCGSFKAGFSIINIDDTPSCGANAASDFWPDANDLAYVIYTSGTTGGPKGVLIEHGSLATTVVGMRDAFGIVRGDRVLQLLSMSFDASLCEAGIALAAGATLVIADEDARIPGESLMQLLRDERVSVATLPPSVVAALPDDDLPNLRVLVFGGEALPPELAGRWLRNRRVFNAYGPTEAAITATVARVQDFPTSLKPNIGFPLPGVEVRILGPDHRPLAAGEIGELAIGGEGVARGYHRQPELTARKFIRAEDGSRLYLSGDLARELPDGSLEFAGRLDRQVKVNGFRIELDEIANVLRSHEGVRDAVAVVRQGQLIAFVSGSDLRSQGLRLLCVARLPTHMVPKAVQVLHSLPLTVNGKVDEAALPDADRESVGLHESRTPPRTPTEIAIASLMSDLLGVNELGMDDNFFSLGGHSLLVGRLVAQIRTELGKNISLSDVYRMPTVAEIALVLDAAKPEVSSAAPTPPPLRKAERDGTIPLSFPQERVWFLEQIVPGNLAYQAQATLRIQGPLNSAVLNQALTEMVRRHEIFRTAFKETDGAPRQDICAPYKVQVPVVSLEGHSEVEFRRRAALLVKEKIQHIFQVDEGPLVRWLLIRQSPLSHILLQMEHHLIHDGWSFAIFVEEFKVLYEAYATGDPSPLPEPALQFGDFATWQRSWLRGDVLTSYLSHWTSKLANLATPLELPTDRPRPPAFRFTGDAVREDFDASEYRNLREGARAHGVTLFTLMLSAFAILLSRYADQRDVVVGVGSANRRLSEAERIIGMIINTLPLRVDLSDDPTFAEVLQRVHETAIDGYAWQDVPLDRLVEALPLPRDPSRNPLFSTIFSFHDVAVPDLEFSGLSARVQLEHNGSAKTDLNIVVIPRAEQRVGRAASQEDESLRIVWEYADDLFNRSTMEAMLRAYRSLLAYGLERPDSKVSCLVLAGPEIDSEQDRLCESAKSLFDRWVKERPQTTALVDCEGRSISYSALDAMASELAQSLSRPGYMMNQPVILPPSRGVDQVATLVACMKLGVPWVPGSWTAEDESHDPIAWEALVAPAMALMSKGFAVKAVVQAARSGSATSFLEVASALLNGVVLRIVDWDLADPRAVSASMEREFLKVGSFSAILPAALSNTLAGQFPQTLAGIDALLVIGLHVNHSALTQCPTACVLLGISAPGRPLIAMNDMPAQKSQTLTSIPRWSGVPVGCELLVHDANGMTCPLGVPGHLHVRPLGEVDAFASPWRARALGQGRFEVSGPYEPWIEIGGFRVDPADAIGTLQTHPAVVDAVVLPVESRLIAYVTTRRFGEIAEGDLRTYALNHSAGCQTPSRILLMDGLPLGPTGEIDKSRLPIPVEAAVPPATVSTSTERRIADICASLLGLNEVDPQTDFFLLGGRSLVATRLISQVNREFGTGVTVARFLRRPIVAELAKAVDEAKDAGTSEVPQPSVLRSAATLLADLDSLSDDEVAALLEKMDRLQ